MSDEALANAFAELHSLQDQQKEIDAQIASLNQARVSVTERVRKAAEFILAWHAFAGKPIPSMESVLTPYQSVAAKVSSPAPLKVTGNPKKEAVAAASIELMVEREAPIPRSELHDLLKERGLEVKGADPLVTLGTMLWRMKDRIVHLQGYGYWARGVPYGPAGYTGGDDAQSAETPNDQEEELASKESGASGLFG